jgi:hypothetical protein
MGKPYRIDPYSKLQAVNLKTLLRRKHRHGDLHFLNEDGMVACNPRDREAAHRAEVEGIATENPQDVTCKKCLAIIRMMRKDRQIEN